MRGAELMLPAGAEAPRAARQILKATLEREGMTGAVLGRLLLIASEIVTTALSRGTARPDDPVQLRVDVADERVRVEVVDQRRARREPGGRFTRAEYGMSYAVIDRLSDRWGLTRGPEGAETWSEVEVGGDVLTHR